MRSSSTGSTRHSRGLATRRARATRAQATDCPAASRRTRRDGGGAANPAPGGADALLAKVKSAQPGIARLLADWLRGIRCRPTLAEALRARGDLQQGEAFVTPHGHVVNAHAIAFFAPDSELHGVLARQRELSELGPAISGAREGAAAARAALAALETEHDEAQTQYHAESLAFTSQQRRCHDLELELLQLRKAAEAAEKRRAADRGRACGDRRTGERRA